MPVWLGSPFDNFASLTRRSITAVVTPPEVGNYYNAVTQGSISGSTSTTALLAAIDAYKAGGYDGLYFPIGVYSFSGSLTVPAGTAIVGPTNAGAGPPTVLQTQASMPWLQGHVIYNSASSFTDLRIGPNSPGTGAAHNNQSSETTNVGFTRCHFRGGGGADQLVAGTMCIGNHANLNYVTFTDCEFERPMNSSFNVTSIYAQGCIVHHITFDGCHVGTSNGSDYGGPRMGCEVWADNGSGNLWHDLSFIDTTFEATDLLTLDFACYGPGHPPAAGQGYNILVDGCLFKGSVNSWSIGLEFPDRLTITNNTFWRSNWWGLDMDNSNLWPVNNHLTLTGNTFDWDLYDPKVASFAWTFLNLQTAYAIVTGNTFRYHGDLSGHWMGSAVSLDGSNSGSGVTGNVVNGNVFDGIGSFPTVGQFYGATGNTITPNTVV